MKPMTVANGYQAVLGDALGGPESASPVCGGHFLSIKFDSFGVNLLRNVKIRDFGVP